MGKHWKQPAIASKYHLGITISSDLSWSTHVEDVAARGNRTVGFLRRNFRECTPKSQVSDLPCNGMPHFGVSLRCLMSPQALTITSNYWDPHIGVPLGCLVSPQTQKNIKLLGSPHRRTPGLPVVGTNTRTSNYWDPHIGVHLGCLVSPQTQEHPTTGILT